MCTLIIGNQVLGPGTIILGANRDEDPGRPSDPPRLLNQSPRVVGGRDRVAGGTWLAVREDRAAVAMLNRRDLAGTGPTRGAAARSRGLITIEVACVATGTETNGDELSDAALARALELTGQDTYAPFSLVFLSPESCWVLTHEPPADARVTRVAPGWHVLTHADLDDPREPRTARLLAGLEPWRPTSLDEAERGLIERLSLHDTPAVCIHEGRMVTVSASVIALGRAGTRYSHVEGRPCERALLPVIGTPSLLA